MKKSVLVPYDKYLIMQQNLNTETQPTSKLELPQPSKLSRDVIISYLPKNIHKKTDILLNELENLDGISWNDQGLVILEGVQKKTHICDLLHFANCGTKKQPPDALEFFEKLNHLPQTILSNTRARVLAGGSSAPPPPPGIPDKQPEKTWKTLWKPL